LKCACPSGWLWLTNRAYSGASRVPITVPQIHEYLIKKVTKMTTHPDGGPPSGSGAASHIVS
jgi:hypothetical protein